MKEKYIKERITLHNFQIQNIDLWVDEVVKNVIDNMQDIINQLLEENEELQRDNLKKELIIEKLHNWYV